MLEGGGSRGVLWEHNTHAIMGHETLQHNQYIVQSGGVSSLSFEEPLDWRRPF